MASMKLANRYSITVGESVIQATVKSEWNGFIELDGGANKGKIIVRRKGWNNGKEWAKEANAFTDQELDILYADPRFCLPDIEVMFVNPDKD